MNCDRGLFALASASDGACLLRIRGSSPLAHLLTRQTSHEGGAVKARACRYRRGNLEGKAYCLIGEGFRNSSVASSIGLPLLTGAPAEPQLVFCFINQSLLRLALWSCGRRVSVVQAQRQIHRVLAGRLHLAVSMARAHLLTAAFDAHRTSHPVAVLRAAGTTIPHSGGHRARKGGSTLYNGISQPLFATVRPPGSNGADQASWNSR